MSAVTAVRLAPPTARDAPVVALAVVLACVLGALVVFVPLALGAVAAAAAFAVVAARPVAGAYAYLVTLPFVAGMERGSVLPFLRPHEAVHFFVAAAVLAGALLRALRHEPLRVSVTRLDRALFTLAALASVWPILWLLLRGRSPTIEDLLSTVVLWRLFALYALFRFAVRTPEQLRRCFAIVLGTGAVLAVLALLQALGAVVIADRFGANPDAGRGPATLGSSIAVGDYVASCLALLLAWSVRGLTTRLAILAVGVMLVVGSLATGQFSAWIAALVVALAVAYHARPGIRSLLAPVAIGAGALAVAWPIVAQRVSAFGGPFGVPRSWLGRADNIGTFVLPQLAGFRWVLGVRPDPVLPAPETWRDQIFIESGVLWLLWVGGVPLLLAFVWFTWVALRHTHAVARARGDEIGVAAIAAWSSLSAVVVLTLIDQHLTLRGAGDLLFVLLGLATNRLVPSDERQPP